jgi:hypothetical protein
VYVGPVFINIETPTDESTGKRVIQCMQKRRISFSSQVEYSLEDGVPGSFEMLVTTHKTTRGHNTELET